MAGARLEWRYFESPTDNMIHNQALVELGREYLSLENIYEFEDYDQEIAYASSDIGNVSHICPTLYMEIGMDGAPDFEIHSKESLKYVNSDYSNLLLLQVSRSTACMALDLLLHPDQLERIRETQSRNIQEYMER